jgi:hypothetical protein
MTMEARGREPQPRFYSRNRLCIFINTRPALALQHIAGEWHEPTTCDA